jgi:hypothetical protein
MNLYSLLLGAAIVLALSACNDAPAPATPPASAPAQAPAAEQTQAFYGDEAPVTVPAEPADDHGHSHEGDADHAHDGLHEHAHGPGAQSPNEDARKTRARRHDHGDGSAPHEH